MGFARIFLNGRRRFFECVIASAAVVFAGATCCAQQAKPTSQQPETPWAAELKKYPGLLPELGRFLERLRREVQFPPEREASHLLSLLPESTMSYAAIPNYGDMAHRTLSIFRDELKESEVLRNWWAHGSLAPAGPKIEDALDKFHQLHEYLGDEIVVSGSLEGKEPKFLAVAEVRKPGLKKFLQQLATELEGGAKPSVRVFELDELATAQDERPSQDMVVLVRPDFVIAAADVATLRSFSARLDRSSHGFVAAAFGKRIAQEYVGGVTVLAAADLHKILEQVPKGNKQDQVAFERSGFADLKYLVWEHKKVAGQNVSQSELSFTGPRHGAAAWLAKTGPLSNLDFVSPSAAVALTIAFASPSQIFDDAKELAEASSGNASPGFFANVPAFEKMLNLSLNDDLLGLLSGEVTLEMDDLATPATGWRAILKVKDAEHLQKTLAALLAAGQVQATQSEEGGITYYTISAVAIGSGTRISYAFADGHLIVASSQDAVGEAVRMHAAGDTLAQSRKFLAAQPPGRSLEASALLYQDSIAMAALQLRQFSPEMAESLAQVSKAATPAVIGVYGEESSIREASTNAAFDMAAVLVAAAVAIPNLLRSKMAANEASAVGSVRTVNVGEVTYAATYPKRGFAPNLATMGIDSRAPTASSPDHAAMLDDKLGNETCVGSAWCTKSGYHFRVTSNCKVRPCKEYVVQAMPVDSNSGVRSFCSTSDGVIRFRMGSPTEAITATECRTWTPLQ